MVQPIQNQTGGTGLNTYMASLVNMDKQIHADNLEFGLLEKLVSTLRRTNEQTGVVGYQTKLSREEKRGLAEQLWAEAEYQVAVRQRKLSPEQRAAADAEDPTGLSLLDIATEAAIGMDIAGIEENFENGPITANAIYRFSSSIGGDYQQRTVVAYIRKTIGQDVSALRENILNLNRAEHLRNNEELSEQIKDKGARELMQILVGMVFEYRAKRDRTQ